MVKYIRRVVDGDVVCDVVCDVMCVVMCDVMCDVMWLADGHSGMVIQDSVMCDLNGTYEF